MALQKKTPCLPLQVVDALPPRTRLGLLAFSAAVAVFDLTRAGVAAAHVSPGHCAASEATAAGLRARRAAHVVPLAACLGNAEAAIRSLRCGACLAILRFFSCQCCLGAPMAHGPGHCRIWALSLLQVILCVWAGR